MALATALTLPAGGVGDAESSQGLYHLAIGDPARKEREVGVVLDAIVDTATGQTLAPAELPDRLRDVRLLLVGETHTSVESHRVQLRVLRALHGAGRDVAIGLEMFPYTQQRSLDDWHDRLLTEDGFVRLAGWYEHWGYDWRYYRDIFLFARDEGVRMYAVNAPREVITAVRKKGLANLTPDEAARIPAKIDLDDPEHMTLFKASFDENDTVHGELSDEAWNGMLSAQATWDASMGWNAVQALRQQRSPNPIVVILAGSGHVTYGLGIERQARQWFDGPIASLIAVPARDHENRPVRRVRASYANYIWGVPAEESEAFPSLGASTRMTDAGLRQIIQVDKKSVAARAGLTAGDVIVSMDGVSARGANTLVRLVAARNWGDTSTFEIRRGDQEKTLTVVFRRAEKDEEPEK